MSPLYKVPRQANVLSAWDAFARNAMCPALVGSPAEPDSQAFSSGAMHMSEATLLLLDQPICQPHTTACPLSATEGLPSQACPSSCPTKLCAIIKSLLFSTPITWAVIIPQWMTGTPLNPQGWNLLAFSMLLFAPHTLIETRCSDQEHGSCSRASWSPRPTQQITSWVASGYLLSCSKSQCEKGEIIQSCPTLCDPTDYRVHGILQARILEWVAVPFPGDLPNPGIKPRSPALQADSLPAVPRGKP